jgi:hypothetical protein
MILVNAQRACGGRRPLRKHRNRWEDAVRTHGVDLFQIRNCKAAARKREGWRKKAGEDIARKRAPNLQGEEEEEEEKEEEEDFLNVCSLLALLYSRYINVLL